MKTAWESMKMGVVIYIVPFFFIFEPALILQGSWGQILLHFSTAMVGVYFLAAGAEGYLFKIKEIGPLERALFLFIGFLWAVPEWRVTAAGAALAIPSLAFLWIRKRTAEKLTVPEEVLP